MPDQTADINAADLADMLPDESLAKLATGYAMTRVGVAQQARAHAQALAVKDGEIQGLQGRIEGLEAQLATARADLGRLRTAPGGFGYGPEIDAEMRRRQVIAINGATLTEARA
jgi:hypothetical protein